MNWIVRDLNQPEMAELDNSDRLTTPRLAYITLIIFMSVCFFFSEKSSSILTKDDFMPARFFRRNRVKFCQRMPWHDVGVAVEGPAARDVARFPSWFYFLDQG